MVYIRLRMNNSNIYIFQDPNTQSSPRNIAGVIDMEDTPHSKALNQRVPPMTIVKAYMTEVATIGVLSTSVP